MAPVVGGPVNRRILSFAVRVVLAPVLSVLWLLLIAYVVGRVILQCCAGC